jgi:cell division protein FtsB
MIPQDNKESLKKIFKHLTDVRILGLLAFGVIAVLITWSGLKTAKTNYELEKQISRLQQRNDVERLENENLKLKNEYYKSQQYLELAARSKFNKAKPGEKLYLVPEEVELSNTLESPSQARKKKARQETGDKPAYQRNVEAWTDFLFNKSGGS